MTAQQMKREISILKYLQRGLISLILLMEGIICVMYQLTRLPLMMSCIEMERTSGSLNDDPEVFLNVSSDQFTCLLALDGVAAVPEGYCCAGSALLFPFHPFVNSGCPYGVGLF